MSKKSALPTCKLLTILAFTFSASVSHASPSKCQAYALKEPLVLTSPISDNTLSVLFNEAESFYKAERFKQATDAYLSLLELSPTHEMTWLRLGNMQQGLGCIEQAQHAFERLMPSGIDPASDVQVRALLNLAIIRAEQTEAVLRRLEPISMQASLAAIRDRLIERYGLGQYHSAVSQTPIASISTPPAVSTAPAPAPAPASVPAAAVGAARAVVLAPPSVVRQPTKLRSLSTASAMATPKNAAPSAQLVSKLPVIQYVGGLDAKN